MSVIAPKPADYDTACNAVSRGIESELAEVEMKMNELAMQQRELEKEAEEISKRGNNDAHSNKEDAQKLLGLLRSFMEEN